MEKERQYRQEAFDLLDEYFEGCELSEARKEFIHKVIDKVKDLEGVEQTAKIIASVAFIQGYYEGRKRQQL